MTSNSPPGFQVNPISAFINACMQAVAQGGEKALEAYITAELPLFGTPILQDVMDYIIEEVGNDLESGPQTLVDFLVTDFQTNHENSVLNQAMIKLSENPDNEGAINASINAWSGLIHYDGSGQSD